MQKIHECESAAAVAPRKFVITDQKNYNKKTRQLIIHFKK